MPQYEIKTAKGGEKLVRVRARTALAAVREHFGLDDGVPVSIESGPEFGALSGWHEVEIEGDVAGQIRVFQRMKFRRV